MNSVRLCASASFLRILQSYTATKLQSTNNKLPALPLE
jgi:hypothetical protein